MKLMGPTPIGLKSEKLDQLTGRNRHPQTAESFANFTF
jgi:hypothetical protein